MSRTNPSGSFGSKRKFIYLQKKKKGCCYTNEVGEFALNEAELIDTLAISFAEVVGFLVVTTTNMQSTLCY